MAESARYLYAVTRQIDSGALADVPGLRGQPLEPVRWRDLTAVVSTVPLAEFDEQALRRNLESLSWLEEVARRHDEVVQAVARHGPTAPLRLATICLDDESVRGRLEEWYPDIEQVLGRIEGRVEWSVKVVVPPEADLVAAGGDRTDEVGAGAGAAYLRRKKAEGEARREHQERVARIGEQVHRQLAGNTVASRVLRPQDPQLSGHVGTMVLNGAYLVEESESEAFAGLVSGIAEAHPELTIECGGPWPAYSFAVLEQR